MTLNTTPIQRFIPTPTTKPRIADIIIGDIGKFKLGPVTFGNIAGRASEAYLARSFAFRVRTGGTVLTFGAVGGGVVPGCPAEVVIGFLCVGLWC